MSEAAELAGRVIAVGIPDPVLGPASRRALERLRPGVVILFRRNVEDPPQLRALAASLHRLPWRPLVAIDHEGGRVTRLGAPFTAFPAAAEIGRAGARAARAVGEAIGRELASAGIDIDFAPVLDVGATDGSSMLGDRAFGRDAATVAEAGVAFASGLLAGGVLPCGKHFPGHGATGADSHLTRPLVSRSCEELAAVDLAPFRAAVHAGLPMLMTAHVLYPALDAERIATLSPAIAGDLLRRELGFAGVLWSDDLTMRAVSAERSPAEAAVAALAAGVDGVLVCHGLEEAQRTAERIRAALGNGELAATRLGEAAARVASLSMRRGGGGRRARRAGGAGAGDGDLRSPLLASSAVTSDKNRDRDIAVNRRARHEFLIEETVEAGLALTGSEVKALREGKANLKDSHARIENGEVWLWNAHISPYGPASQFGHEPTRTRKLLLHRAEIERLHGKVKERGFTLVPLRLYFKKGCAKVELALARGKKQHDKREAIRDREQRREIDRALSARRRSS